MAKPWYTSNDLIAAVKRKISFPVSQNTFSDNDILAFSNEEMFISQVPSMLEFHEEYFVVNQDMPLRSNVNRYPIPERSIGQRLRDLFYKDASGNLFEMTRVSSDDRAFFGANIGANTSVHKYYFEGNEVVLVPQVIQDPTGFLNFVYFLRPNQLVKDENAAIIQNFLTTMTIDNTTILAGDTVTIDELVFTAVAGAPAALQFQIGGNSIQTASNLATAINLDGTYSASNGPPLSNILNIFYSTLKTTINGISISLTQKVIVSNSVGFAINTLQGILFDQIPEAMTEGVLIDFLQTKSGHKMRGFSRTLQDIDSTIGYFSLSEVPVDLVNGDYICLENECIIPQIPDDLHNALAERTCARILAAIGDQQGLAASNAKLGEIERRQGTLIDNRSEGNPQKITARHSILRYGSMGWRRRI